MVLVLLLAGFFLYVVPTNRARLDKTGFMVLQQIEASMQYSVQEKLSWYPGNIQIDSPYVSTLLGRLLSRRSKDFFNGFLLMKDSGFRMISVYRNAELPFGRQIDADTLFKGSVGGFYPGVTNINSRATTVGRSVILITRTCTLPTASFSLDARGALPAGISSLQGHPWTAISGKAHAAPPGTRTR